MKIEKYATYLVDWIKKEVNKAGMRGVIVGISGGVDSAVVATLAKKAFPNNSLGVWMPISNLEKDYQDAKSLIKKIEIKSLEVNLLHPFNLIAKTLKLSNKIAIANIKPRLRMTTLYALAQERKYLVLGTDNAAEWILGYFTKYGDGGVDLLPIVRLRKQDVKNLAKIFNLPKTIYTKQSTAGLWADQTDEKELGFSYEEVDKYLRFEKISKKTLVKIENLIRTTKHKRVSLPKPKPFEKLIL